MTARSWILAIDFGTSYTVAAAVIDGENPAVLAIGGELRVPSVILVDGDRIVVGKVADELSAARPAEVLRAPKNRIGDRRPLIFGGRAYSAVDLVAALLGEVYREAVQQFGGPPREVRITHPATWDQTKLAALAEAANRAGLPATVLVAEPVAAALFYWNREELPAGGHVVIYDLGGGTFDIAVLQSTGDGFRIVGHPQGNATLGGDLFDEIVTGLIGSKLDSATWERIRSDDEPAWQQTVVALRNEARRAKETLSSYHYVDVVAPLPSGLVNLRITRDELERELQPHLDGSIALLRRCIDDAGLAIGSIVAIQLVGGSTRIPAVEATIRREIPDIDVHRRGDPKNVVALGALLLPSFPPPSPPSPLSFEQPPDPRSRPSRRRRVLLGSALAGLAAAAVIMFVLVFVTSPNGKDRGATDTAADTVATSPSTSPSTASSAATTEESTLGTVAPIESTASIVETTDPTTTSTAAQAFGSVVIASDFPLQGIWADISAESNRAIELVLEEANEAGAFEVTLVKYDSSTASGGDSDPDTCAANANAHVVSAPEVALIGPFSSQCSAIQIPILNNDPNGPMIAVSSGATDPGMTREWGPGEPDVYYPTGVRNYARVIPTDDLAGTAAAEFAHEELGVRRCVVLDDNGIAGTRVAAAFVASAAAIGLEVVSTGQWVPGQPSYVDMFASHMSADPDCIFLSASSRADADRLVADKVAALGANTEQVKLIAPALFNSAVQLGEGEGMYLAYPGLPISALIEYAPAAAFAERFRTAYGVGLTSGYGLYAAAAMQLVLAAVAESDGTRTGVREAMFSGVSVAAEDSLIGREFGIDEYGDVTVHDVSIWLVTGGQQQPIANWSP